MNDKDIIRMAREAGIQGMCTDVICTFDELTKFAQLVAEAEREACHKLRQTLLNPYDHCNVSAHAYDMAVVDYGKAIRAIG